MIFFQNYKNKIFILLFSILTVLASFSYTLDTKGKAFVNANFSESVVVFGSAKALNAVISLAQGTELDLPFVTLAIGEVLDPINDLVEQFSLVMLASTVSLGIQKIMMNFVVTDVYNYVLLGLIIFTNIFLFLNFTKSENIRALFFKITMVLIFLRFAVPLMGIANDYAYNSFVKQEYNIQILNENIITVKENVSKVTQSTIEEKADHSIIDKISKLTEKFDSQYYDKKIEEYKTSVDNASEYIISLIIVFVFQTIFLPLLFLFILYQFIKGIFTISRK